MEIPLLRCFFKKSFVIYNLAEYCYYNIANSFKIVILYKKNWEPLRQGDPKILGRKESGVKI